MLKLLIVDDEPIIRSGIRVIIDWARYGYEICGEAEDGPGAVDAIVKMEPDLVLLDIHLPGFSGLDVIRKIRAANAASAASAAGARTHFLILSGYAEFEYAKDAINLEADGYITKPIDENILVQRISSIAGKIREDDDQRQIQFLEILEGTYNAKNHEYFYFENGFVQAVFVSPDNALSRKKTQVIKSFFNKDICRVFSYRNFIVFLFENKTEISIKRMLENLCAFLAKSKDIKKNAMPHKVTMGSRRMEESSSPGSGIRQTCMEAEMLMDNVFFCRDREYLTVDDVPRPDDTNKNAPDWSVDNEAGKICALLQVVDPVKIREFFSGLEDSLRKSGKPPQRIRQECFALMIEIRGVITRKFPALKDLSRETPLEMPGTGEDILDAIIKERYLADIVDIMAEACISVSEALPLLSADSNFQRIISYVKNNFSEDLKLETMGRLFSYNCAYLGKRFKEYTGMNFHSYLDMLRIDAAKEMLENTGMKVYEISSAVGYANTDYFYSKFKKFAGKSPLDFRKKCNNPRIH